MYADVAGGGSQGGYGYLSAVADNALLQPEPMEQSFSEYLKNDFVNGSDAA